jgi:hypothetical protein
MPARPFVLVLLLALGLPAACWKPASAPRSALAEPASAAPRAAAPSMRAEDMIWISSGPRPAKMRF